MSCPNCDSRLKEMTLDNQPVLHCDTCGGSFFEENGINRISAVSAEPLSKVRGADDNFSRLGGGARTSTTTEQKQLTSSPESINTPLFCPRDHAALSPILDEETIPQGLELLKCPTCQGVFANPVDLLKFKKAQEAKIEYFRLWERPIPSLHAVLVLSFVVIVSASAYFMGNTILQNGSTRTQATEVVERVTIITSGRYTLVSFQTTLPYRSEIILINKTTGGQTIKEISKEQSSKHLVTLTNISPDEDIFYKIRLTDNGGKITETEERKLESSP